MINHIAVSLRPDADPAQVTKHIASLGNVTGVTALFPTEADAALRRLYHVAVAAEDPSTLLTTLRAISGVEYAEMATRVV